MYIVIEGKMITSVQDCSLPPLPLYLASENKVGKTSNAGSIGDKIGDRFHDIPGVINKGQPGKEPCLN